MARDKTKLYINEIFTSISGEVGLIQQGSWTTFIRLQGCNQNCSWCDTKHSIPIQWNDDQKWEIGEVIDKISHQVRQIIITGGEPLLQQEPVLDLIKALRAFDRIHFVQIETGGSIEPGEGLHNNVDSWVVDYKLNGSGMNKLMKREMWYGDNFTTGCDYIKFVISDRGDFDQAVEVQQGIEILNLNAPLRFAYSPCAPDCTPAQLYEWFAALGPRPHTMMNLQIHKVCMAE